MTQAAKTESSTRSSSSPLGRRFLKAAEAMSQAIVKGIDRMLEGVLPVPQAIPVRVRSQPRRR